MTRRVHDLADDLRTFWTGSSCASGAESAGTRAGSQAERIDDETSKRAGPQTGDVPRPPDRDTPRPPAGRVHPQRVRLHGRTAPSVVGNAGGPARVATHRPVAVRHPDCLPWSVGPGLHLHRTH